jgi:hypothetical protein
MRARQQPSQPIAEWRGAGRQHRHGGPGAVDEQLAKVFVAAPRDPDQSGLSAAPHLARHQPEPGCEIASTRESLGVANGGHQRRRIQHTDASASRSSLFCA